MRKNVIIGLFTFVSLFMFTGCIDFLEEITYHKDGSGTYQFTVDMGAMKSMLDGLGSDEEKEKDPTKDIDDKFKELEDKLKNIKGISQFKNINDTSAFVFGFSFDFKDALALNRALALALHEQDDKLASSTNLFSGSKRTLTRFNKGSMAETMKNELAGEETDEEQMAMVKSMFGDMKLRTIYHFDRRVKSSSNVNSLISADNKNVTIDYYFFKPELNKGNDGVGTVIKLKRR